MEPEYPFRWAGVYELTGEFYDLRLHGVTFPKMKTAILPVPEGAEALDELREEAMLLFSENKFAYRMADAYAPDASFSSSRPRVEVRHFASRSKHPEDTRSSRRGVSRSLRPPSVVHLGWSSSSRCRHSSRTTSTTNK
jgi:hypothetical protein